MFGKLRRGISKTPVKAITILLLLTACSFLSIYLVYYVRNEVHHNHHIETIKVPRVALVRSHSYGNLYGCEQSNIIHNGSIAMFTRRHLGPVGLFTQLFQTKFIALIDNTRSQVVRDKLENCKFFKDDKLKPDGCAQDENDVDWSQFDMVLSVDDAVTPEIIKRYPSVMWAYYVSEGCAKSDKQSFENPLFSYDHFLTQNAFETISHQKEHVIELPWTFSFFGQMHEHYPTNKTAIVVESNSSGQPELMEALRNVSTRFGLTLQPQSGTVANNHRFMSQAKYFVRLHSVPRRGNTIAEALAFGGVMIANSQGMLNHVMMTMSKLDIYNVQTVVDEITKMEQDPVYFQKMRQIQKEAFNYYYFQRPYEQLINKTNAVYERRGIQKRLQLNPTILNEIIQ